MGQLPFQPNQLKLISDSNLGKHYQLINRDTGERVASQQVEKIDIKVRRGVTRVVVTLVDIPIEISAKPVRESDPDPDPEIVNSVEVDS